MPDETEGSGLSAAEEAYFNSGGETPLDQTPQPEQEGTEPAPEPVAGEPEPEVTAEPPRNERGQFIPHSVFHAEREEHKKTKAELQEAREFKAAMEERMAWFKAAAQPEQPKPVDDDPEPDVNTDIFAHSAWQARQLSKLRTTYEAERQQAEEQRQSQAQENQLWEHWHQSAQQFKAATPDFESAAQWLAEYRDKQLVTLSKADQRFADKRVRDAQMNDELKQLIYAAHQQRRSPAELVYEIAQGYGYTRGAKVQPDHPAAPLQLSPQLQKVADAQVASRSIAQAPGRAGGDELSLEQIMSMPRGEFSQWSEVPANKRLLDKLMGA